MPEGHTIHRRARDHGRWFGGHLVQSSSPQGRFQAAQALDGTRLHRVDAIGKHLLYHFAEHTVHVHLGLFGKFRLHRGVPPDPRETVRWRLQAEDRTLDLTGPTAAELYRDADIEALRHRLGPDPLDPAATAEQFRAGLHRRRRSIGAALLDQKLVAGIGNVYRAELLWRARIDPYRPCNELDDTEVVRLWEDMVQLLAIGVKYDRIITVDPHTTSRPMSRLRRGERLNIYKQRACPSCAGRVGSYDLGGRTLYACPRCQDIHRGAEA